MTTPTIAMTLEVCIQAIEQSADDVQRRYEGGGVGHAVAIRDHCAALRVKIAQLDARRQP